MLDLIRLSRHRPFPPGGTALFRHIGLLTGMGPDTEVLDVACGSGRTLEYLHDEFGVHGAGVEADPSLVAEGEERLKARGGDRLLIQSAPHDELPYRDEIFDVAIGQIGLASRSDPERAIHELARVTRPGGSIVLVQLAWKAPVTPERQRMMAEYLGAPPMMLVEWKRLLREAGVSGLHTEDWSNEETAFRPHIAKPFPDFSELFSWPEKLAILSRARRRWGWSGVWEALRRDRKVHAFLTRERILGLDLIKGTKGTPVAVEALGHEPGIGEEDEREQVEGLPLFGAEDGDSTEE